MSSIPLGRLTGIIPPVITPFAADGSVDHPVLAAHIEQLIGAGVHGLFALGSTAETAYLGDRDREAVIATIVAAAAGRVPVLAGCIELTAPRVIQQARTAQALGASAVVATPTFYALNSVVEQLDHYRRIAAAVEIPVIAYDVPVRVHSKLTVPMLVQLGSEGTIVAVKDSSGDDVGFRRLIAANRAAGSPMSLLTGHEIVCDGMLLAGADGVVPGLANVDAAGYLRMWEAARSGDWGQARAEQERLNQLFEIVFLAVGRSGDAAGVGAFKAAMVELGLIPSARMADPVQALDGPVLEQLTGLVRQWRTGDRVASAS